MMTIEEIGALQIGDKVMLTNGVEATVVTVNQSNQLVALSMVGGTTVVIPGFGVVPPERTEAESTIICPWSDLLSATKV